MKLKNGQINNDIIGRDFGSALTNMSSDFSYFKKPKSLALGEFFDFHPHQLHLTHPFKSSKVFLGKNNIQRRWLTYDEHSEKLFCSVCLAFSSERNIFIDGFNTWSHVYQRVQEHEIIKSHNLSSEAFLNYSSKKTIDYRLFSEHLHKKKIEVTKNRNILQRVIDVIKLIGKRGLSYRGHRNEGADSLNDSTLDHGNFLDILLLLKKYDVVLSEHIDSITKNASVNHKKGKGKGGGASLIFISKTTVNMVIDSISYLMKKSISDEIRDAVMFSVQLDTTQDISVQDQCSIILRYVNYKGIQERLLAVITVQQSTGKSFSDMFQGVLADNGLDVMKCIGNATDGAANMQGQFNGFSAWLEKSTPNQMELSVCPHMSFALIDLSPFMLFLFLSLQSGRGGNQIALCLMQAINSGHLSFYKRHLTVWSDNCAGQLKNRMLLFLCIWLVANGTFDTIEHTFFISGYSYSASDRDFATIEKRA
ncbi:hypothetical protein QTP88_028200 [Uroleucon formosanum]